MELTRLCDFWCVPSRRFIADPFSMNSEVSELEVDNESASDLDGRFTADSLPMDSEVSEPEVDDELASELDCDDEPSEDLLSLEFESLSSSLSGGPESTVVFVPV